MPASRRTSPAVRLAPADRGFTLVELLVVVIIIGLLAAIAIPIFLAQRDQALGAAVASAVVNAKGEFARAAVEGEWPSPAEEAAILAAHSDPDITLTVDGDADGFCVSGSHSALSLTWAADSGSGVARPALCAADGTRVGG